MINSSMNVGDFCRSLVKRVDGWLLICASAACFVLLIFNAFTPVASSLGLQSSGKWIALWATWPIVLFVAHLRLRTLFDETGLVALICRNYSAQL